MILTLSILPLLLVLYLALVASLPCDWSIPHLWAPPCLVIGQYYICMPLPLEYLTSHGGCLVFGLCFNLELVNLVLGDHTHLGEPYNPP